MAQVFKAKEPVTLKVPLVLDSDGTITHSSATSAGQKDLALNVASGDGLDHYTEVRAFVYLHAHDIAGAGIYINQLKASATFEMQNVDEG